MNADDLAKILDELGQRLGPTGEHVFQLAVRQVYIDAVTNVVVLILLGAAFFALASRFRVALEEDDASYASLFLGTATIAIGAVNAFAAMSLIFALTRVLNPEYAALRDIIQTIR